MIGRHEACDKVVQWNIFQVVLSRITKPLSEDSRKTNPAINNSQYILHQGDFTPGKPLQFSVPQPHTVENFTIPADHLFIRHFPGCSCTPLDVSMEGRFRTIDAVLGCSITIAVMVSIIVNVIIIRRWHSHLGLKIVRHPDHEFVCQRAVLPEKCE